MNLDEAQKQRVAAWIAEGLKLSDIQKRLETELGIRLTYLDTRLLVDDLKLVPKETEHAKPVEIGKPGEVPPGPAARGAKPGPGPEPPGQAVGGVSVAVDTVARPGALVSGRVTFSDGNSADWSLDQYGRLGLTPQQPGYRPSQADVQAFQAELQTELQRMGF